MSWMHPWAGYWQLVFGFRVYPFPRAIRWWPRVAHRSALPISGPLAAPFAASATWHVAQWIAHAWLWAVLSTERCWPGRKSWRRWQTTKSSFVLKYCTVGCLSREVHLRSCHKPNFSVNLLGLLCPSASGAEDSKTFIGTTSIFRQFYEQNAFADAETSRMSKSLLSTRLLSKRSILQVSRRHENLSGGIFMCLQHLLNLPWAQAWPTIGWPDVSEASLFLKLK